MSDQLAKRKFIPSASFELDNWIYILQNTKAAGKQINDEELGKKLKNGKGKKEKIASKTD